MQSVVKDAINPSGFACGCSRAYTLSVFTGAAYKIII